MLNKCIETELKSIPAHVCVDFLWEYMESDTTLHRNTLAQTFRLTDDQSVMGSQFPPVPLKGSVKHDAKKVAKHID